MAITASFIPAASLLSIFGDNLDNNVDIIRNAAGNILVNGGAVPVLGGTPTVANTALIQVFGQGGNDTITMNESNGPLPGANLFGGDGNDTITGGSGGDMLFGQSGNDVLLGKDGNDFLFGGSENDVLTGGDGDDQVFGESGNDRMIWNPGDDTDLFEGGTGDDTAEVNGAGGAEVFTVTANGARVRFDRLDPAPFSIDIGTTENLVVNMNGGDDFFSATGNLAALIKITVDGGAGNDTILGSNGADLLRGGTGNDFIDGQQGDDVAVLGAGDDTFQWDPGDGSDVVEGGDGTDSMLFNGSAGAEIFTLSANGGRALFTRNLGNIVMDLDDVEKIDLNALGNTDTVTVNDMSRTDVVKVNVNLAGTIGGTAGDGAADVVIINATDRANVIDVVGAGTGVSVLGLAARTNILNSEGANDSLVINGLGGNDTIRATTLPAGVIKLTIDAGAGNDSMLGSQGADTFLGGDGNDFVFGDNGNDVASLGAGNDVFQWDPGDGNDVASLGAGNDVFQWDPGDGNDTVEGQDGIDTLDFNGANVDENVDIVANGGRVLFLRNIASVTMDLDDVETIDFDALGGVDNIVVGDLSGTDARQINIDLAGPNGGGDGAADNVTVNATQGSDAQINVTSKTNGTITVDGLAAKVVIENGEAANDRLTINGQGGDDVINATGVAAGKMKLTLNGGLGNDVFFGGAGDDFINGGDGNDVAFMGAGNDNFVWNPGDDNDTLEGQAGTDTMLFNGANVAENITISANGGRAIFFRDIATVTMDLNDTEVVDFNALGGTDNIFVNDLSGTDVTKVNIDLAGTIGGATGDNLADNIFIQGTDGDDVISLSIQNGALVIDGLASQIVIEHFDINDTIHIAGLSGDDVIEASGVGVAGLKLSFDGGNGNDVLIGSDGADTLLGGAGDDVLLGGGGLDVIDGGDGDDIEIQGATTLSADAPALEVDTPTIDPVLATRDVKEPPADPMPSDGGQGEDVVAGIAQAPASAKSASQPAVMDEGAAPSASQIETGAGVEPSSPSTVAGGSTIELTDDGATGTGDYRAGPVMEEASGGKPGEVPKMLTFGNPSAQLLDYVLALDAMSGANAGPWAPAIAPGGHAMSGASVDHADAPAPVEFAPGAPANPDYFFV